MRISLSAPDVVTTDRLRAYAEYRLFTSVARHGTLVRGAAIVVKRESAGERRFVCTIALDLGPAGRIKTQARGRHTDAAIDRVAERAAWLLDRRVRGAAFQSETAPFTS